VNHGSALFNYSEMEIAGYRDVLALIHQEYAHLEFDEKRILDLHKNIHQIHQQENTKQMTMLFWRKMHMETER